MTTRFRLTGSELAFSILNELHEYALKGDEELFRSKLIELTREVLTERPACMSAINVLRAVLLRYIEHGFNGISDFVADLRSRYDHSLWRAAEMASRRVLNGEKVLTNSNSLAVRRLLKTLHDQGKEVVLYVTESRPGNEGLLMAEYAENLGYSVHLIVDSAARFFMKDIDKVFVGAEAIASNGAVVSKVGTSLISLVAKEARKRIFVIAPSFKLSYETIHGELLRVPEKDFSALVSSEDIAKLPSGYKARVPIYDVTPPEYVDAIITEYGLYAPQAVPILLRLIYGSYPPQVTPIEDILSLVSKT